MPKLQFDWGRKRLNQRFLEIVKGRMAEADMDGLMKSITYLLTVELDLQFKLTRLYAGYDGGYSPRMEFAKVYTDDTLELKSYENKLLSATEIENYIDIIVKRQPDSDIVLGTISLEVGPNTFQVGLLVNGELYVDVCYPNGETFSESCADKNQKTEHQQVIDFIRNEILEPRAEVDDSNE